MQHKTPTADCGVLIARFQVSELSSAHRTLIEHVMDRHPKVIVVLGVAPLAASFHNPLDFESRKQMILADYPSLTVLPLADVNNDTTWSKQLDVSIRFVLSPTQTALLYGGRDSFIRSYVGRYDTVELPESGGYSGTQHREELGRVVRDSPDWRAGVIWGSRNRFPVSYTCADIAIFNEDYSRILLGRKPYEIGWRLPGGFTDPGSESIEHDAEREVLEETGLTVEGLVYLGSFPILDWRYRNEPDSIKTVVYACTVPDIQIAEASDDLAEVQWFGVEPFDLSSIMPIHRPLLVRALAHANNRSTS